MSSLEATAPPGMVWVAPVKVVIVCGAWKFWIAPWLIRISAPITAPLTPVAYAAQIGPRRHKCVKNEPPRETF